MFWLHPSAALWHYPTFLLPPLMVIGIIECFAGYHAWRFLLGLNGAVVGFIGGAMVCVLTGNPILLLVGAVVGAIVGAALFSGIVPVGSTVFAFGSLASLTIILGSMMAFPEGWRFPVAAVAGIGGAIAVLTARRPAMISIAAVAGAQQIASAWSAYWLPSNLIPVPDAVIPSEWTAFLLLSAAGLVIQFAMSSQRHLGMQDAAATGAALTS